MQEQMDASTVQSLRRQLEQKREEIVAMRQKAEDSREQLGQREPEQQERAQAEARAFRMHGLDEESRQQLWEVDAALTRIELGNYGMCTGCGKLISVKRLQAAPWTRSCLECAENALERSAAMADADVGLDTASTLPSQQAGPLPEDFQGLESDRFSELLLERLALDPRIPVRELDPVLEQGRLVLQGVVPSEPDRQLLLQVLHDSLGFTDLQDQLRVDPMLWKREPQQSAPPEDAPRSEEQELLEGESASEDLQDAVEQGGSVVPPDRFTAPEE